MFGVDGLQIHDVITIGLLIVSIVHSVMTRWVLMNNHIRHLQEGQNEVKGILNNILETQKDQGERIAKIEGRLNGEK